MTEKDVSTLQGKTICEWANNELENEIEGTAKTIPSGVWFETMDTPNSVSEPGLYFATGTFTMRVDADGLTACKKKDGIYLSGSVTFSVEDKYDWHGKKGITLPTAAIGAAAKRWSERTGNPMPKMPGTPIIGIDDSFFIALEREGLGKNFTFEMKPTKATFKESKCN